MIIQVSDGIALHQITTNSTRADATYKSMAFAEASCFLLQVIICKSRKQPQCVYHCSRGIVERQKQLISTGN